MNPLPQKSGQPLLAEEYLAQKAKQLGIAALENRKTVATCLWRGWLYINLPVFVLILGGSSGLLMMMKASHSSKVTLETLSGHNPSTLELALAVPFFILIVLSPILSAWLWWSFNAPKWRLWALQNVDDWSKLERAAIADGLIWPRGSVFNRTEIKSSAQKKLEQELIKYRDQYG